MCVVTDSINLNNAFIIHMIPLYQNYNTFNHFGNRTISGVLNNSNLEVCLLFYISISLCVMISESL